LVVKQFFLLTPIKLDAGEFGEVVKGFLVYGRWHGE